MYLYLENFIYFLKEDIIMKKITQRVIGLLVVFAVLIMSVTVDVPTAKASLLSEVHYTFESGIPSRTVYCNGHTSEVTIYVDGFYCNVSIDSNPIIEARCDKFGTLWLQRFEDTGFVVVLFCFILFFALFLFCFVLMCFVCFLFFLFF